MNSKLHLRVSGQKDCRDMHSFPTAVRSSHIIHHVKKGKGTFIINGKKYEISAGDSFYIPPDTPVCYYPEKDNPWVYEWVDFETHGDSLLSLTAFCEKTPVCKNTGQEIIKLFGVLQSAENESEEFYDGILTAVISAYGKCFPSEKVKIKKDTLYLAKQYIFNNYHRSDLSITEIANYCAVSRATLFRVFKNGLNVSPKDYIAETRITAAKELLKNTNYSIKVISYSVGIYNQLYFSKFFKAKTSFSPSEYRKKERP